MTNLLADDFSGRLAEDTLCRAVDRFDKTFVVDGDDPIRNAVKDRAVSRFAVSQSFLGALALSNFALESLLTSKAQVNQQRAAQNHTE